MKGQIGVVFQGHHSGEFKSAVQVYKSAEMKANLTQIEIHTRNLTNERLNWEVFQGQSSGEFKSAVQLYKSAEMKV